MLFRDWFHAHPEAVSSYTQFKHLLAQSVPDTDTYTDIKDPVVDLVIAVARIVGAETGWTPYVGGDFGSDRLKAENSERTHAAGEVVVADFKKSINRRARRTFAGRSVR